MASSPPKNVCGPVSSTSPSRSFHDESSPPRIGRFSTTVALRPASARYLAAARPASPAPMISVSSADPVLLRGGVAASSLETSKGDERRNVLGDQTGVQQVIEDHVQTTGDGRDLSDEPVAFYPRPGDSGFGIDGSQHM